MNDPHNEELQAAYRKLVAAYSHGLDIQSQDLDAGARIASLFTENGMFETQGAGQRGVRMVGRAELTDGFQRSSANRRHKSMHLCTNLVAVQVAEDLAEGVCYFLIIRESETRADSEALVPATVGSAGLYRDVLERTAEGWLFKERRAELLFCPALG